MSKCKWWNGEFKPCIVLKANEYYFKNGSVRIMDSDPISFCPFCGSSLKKPIVIKPGMFGKFWDCNEEICDYGILEDISENIVKNIDEEISYPYVKHGLAYRSFSPGLPAEFNQDGTVKYESM